MTSRLQRCSMPQIMADGSSGRRSAGADVDAEGGGLKSLLAAFARSSAPEDADSSSVSCPIGSLPVDPLESAIGAMNTCPFGHGSVGTGPFPGYTHGRHPAICPNGCTPDPALGKYGREGESSLETLVREALEYQDLYHREKGNSDATKQARIQEILAEIQTTGTYRHTFDELQHGTRVAWRNAPKCANRKFWEELNLLDYRHVDTPEGMFQACLELLEVATLSCVTTTNIVCFRPQTPGTQDGPRVWSSQIIRFAGYRQADGTVIGDKAEVDFTSMLQDEFDWEPPAEKTQFDVLPVVLQMHPDQEPKVFSLPPQYVPRVPISHPDHPQIAELGLQWYAVPAVSNIELSVGGLIYTAAPFNGWYAVTEIVRNLTDECRYDKCAAVASKLGLDMRTDGNMWRDMAIVTVTQAVMHSFRAAGYGMVDHHTLMKNFWSWYNREKDRRGFAPGNWKWIIPPVSPTANSHCYLELNKMTEYTLKPGFWNCPGFKSYLKRLNDSRKATHGKLPMAIFRRVETPRPSTTWRRAAAGGQAFMLIIYASVTGTTTKYAEAVASVIRSAIPVAVVNMEDFEADGWSEMISWATFVVLMTSTYGPGAPPSSAGKFLSWVQKGLALGGEAREAFDKKAFAVLGFGCTSYPRFCAAADTVHSLMCATGAEPLLPVTKVDCLSHEEVSVWGWTRELLGMVVQKDLLEPHVAEVAAAHIPITLDGKAKPFVPCYTLIDLGGVQGVRPATNRFRSKAAVVEVRELRRGNDAEGEATKQVILDVSGLPGGGLSYLAGDELAVWAENPSEAVSAVAAALGLHGSHLDAMFLLQKDRKALAAGEDAPKSAGASGDDDESGLDCAPFPLPNTYRTILTRYIALCDKPSYEAMRALPLYAPEDERLKAIGKSHASYQDWVNATGVRWCDMWKEFPALMGRLPASVFFQLAPTIKPRHYSISSSAAHHPGRLHLTVARLAYRLPSGEMRAGFCSSFLASRQPGDRVCVKVLPTPGFRMPLNPAAPVIMVAAGTGIAPFKSFWEERLARSASPVVVQKLAGKGQLSNGQQAAAASTVKQQLGPGVLIFGCRNSTNDFIYCDTIQEALAEGALSRVVTAFSREPAARKQYVQDVVVTHAEDLAPLLANPSCHVYVCGSSNMAQEVAMAFQKVMGAHEFTQLIDNGRYHEDVFGIVVPDYRSAIKAAAAKGTIALLGNASITEVAEMLDSGALSLDSLDHAGRTLLHVAVQARNVQLVEMLLGRDCTVNVLDMYGCTPLQLARMTGQTELATLLEAKGGRLVSRLVSQFYPLHAAVMENDLPAVRSAISEGANLAATEHHGLTPLHVACAVSGRDVLQALIDAGAPLDATTMRGLLPLQLALALQRIEATELLQAAGAPLVVKQVVTAGAEGDAGSAAVAWSPQSSDDLLAAVGLTEEELAALHGSWAYLSGVAFHAQHARMEEFSTQFFLSLSDQSPGLLRMFPFKDNEGRPLMAEIKAHGVKVFSMLGTFLMLLSNFSVLTRIMQDLVERHIGYGVELPHYEVFINLQMDVLAKELGPRWDATTSAGWRKTFDLLRRVARTVYDKRHQLLQQQESTA